MSLIDTVAPAQARADVAEMYRLQQDGWGYVPNYAKVFSHRPALMARWGALLMEVKRPLDRRRLELVTFAAAHELGNSACSLAHGRALREFFTDDEIVAIAQGRIADLLPADEQAMIRFSRRVARNAAAITAEDVADLRAHGLSDTDIFDIAAVAAARAFFTKLLDATGVLPDAPFADLPDELREALTVGRPIDRARCEMLPVESAAHADA